MSRAPEPPQPSERQTRWVSKDAQIIGGPHNHEISIGAGCVIHPLAVIDATEAPIRIGNYCIVDEHACIASPPPPPAPTSASSAPHMMVIGDYNHVGPHCRLQSVSIGSDNAFHARSSTGMMSVVGNRCVFAPTARVTHDAAVPDGTSVLPDGRWGARVIESLDVQDERDVLIKRSRFFRSAQLA